MGDHARIAPRGARVMVLGGGARRAASDLAGVRRGGDNLDPEALPVFNLSQQSRKN